jgi:hypothetical protein
MRKGTKAWVLFEEFRKGIEDWLFYPLPGTPPKPFHRRKSSRV